MRVEVVRSGGFAGRTVHWEVDTADLPEPARAELHDLLAGASSWAGGTEAGADRFGYRLHATGDDQDLDLRFGEAAPPEARRLLDLVRGAAAPQQADRAGAPGPHAPPGPPPL